MDLNSTWRTREEKLEAVRYWWREQRAICWICKDRENPMEPYSHVTLSPWAASVEHLIPKRDNGPDTVGNIRLAHRWCNNALGALWGINKDRTAKGLEPLTEKWMLNSKRGALFAARVERSARRRHIRAVPVPEETVRGEKLIRGTLAWKLKHEGESLPRGATLPKPDKRSTLEQLADIEWTWLRQLITPRAEQCGLGSRP